MIPARNTQSVLNGYRTTTLIIIQTATSFNKKILKKTQSYGTTNDDSEIDYFIYIRIIINEYNLKNLIQHSGLALTSSYPDWGPSALEVISHNNGAVQVIQILLLLV